MQCYCNIHAVIDMSRSTFYYVSEAKQLATEFNCKYTETSAALNHNVDELLVGILRQIKIKLTPDLSETVAQVSDKSDRKRSKEHKGLLSKLFKRKSKLPTDVLLDINWIRFDLIYNDYIRYFSERECDPNEPERQLTFN